MPLYAKAGKGEDCRIDLFDCPHEDGQDAADYLGWFDKYLVKSQNICIFSSTEDLIKMETSYSPVEYVYREVIEEEISKRTSGKVFYFNSEQAVDSIEGRIIKMEEMDGKGLFITLEPEAHLRIDRIITLFGKPGAAFDEYDAYANQCLSCTGGYDL